MGPLKADWCNACSLFCKVLLHAQCLKKHSSNYQICNTYFGYEFFGLGMGKSGASLKHYDVIKAAVMAYNNIKVRCKSTDVSELHVLYILRAEEQAKEETSLVLLFACFVLISSLSCSVTLKMETLCSSETSDDFQRTMRYSIPEDKCLIYYYCLKQMVPFTRIMILQFSALFSAISKRRNSTF
jgi:hypothetical protein